MKKIISIIIVAMLTVTYGCENALEEKNYGQIANEDLLEHRRGCSGGY